MATWKIDPSHSEIEFQIRHLVISKVRGKFRKFDSEVEAENDDLTNAKVRFEADVDSIDTNNSDRDTHLKSDDFFNAAEHPKLTFESTSFEKAGENKFKLAGDLTIRGNTKPITLDVEYGGEVVDGYGQTKRGFEVTGEISRKEFGLHWNAITEAGSVVVSDEVKLLLSVQYVKQ